MERPSGEFHTYRMHRRREMLRLNAMHAEDKANAAEEAFRKRRAEVDAMEEAKLEKNRSKRAKKKAKVAAAREAKKAERAASKNGRGDGGGGDGGGDGGAGDAPSTWLAIIETRRSSLDGRPMVTSEPGLVFAARNARATVPPMVTQEPGSANTKFETKLAPAILEAPREKSAAPAINQVAAWV